MEYTGIVLEQNVNSPAKAKRSRDELSPVKRIRAALRELGVPDEWVIATFKLHRSVGVTLRVHDRLYNRKHPGANRMEIKTYVFGVKWCDERISNTIKDIYYGGWQI